MKKIVKTKLKNIEVWFMEIGLKHTVSEMVEAIEAKICFHALNNTLSLLLQQLRLRYVSRP